MVRQRRMPPAVITMAFIDVLLILVILLNAFAAVLSTRNRLNFASVVDRPTLTIHVDFTLDLKAIDTLEDPIAYGRALRDASSRPMLRFVLEHESGRAIRTHDVLGWGPPGRRCRVSGFATPISRERPFDFRGSIVLEDAAPGRWYVRAELVEDGFWSGTLGVEPGTGLRMVLEQTGPERDARGVVTIWTSSSFSPTTSGRFHQSTPMTCEVSKA